MTDHPGDDVARRGAAGDEPFNDPGIPEHQHRPTDVDTKQERRAERQVAAMFGISTLLTLGFVVAFFAIPEDALFMTFNANNFALGMTLGGALLLIGIGAIHWAKKLMTDTEIVEIRHPAASSKADREYALAELYKGTEESGIGRRSLIRNSLIGSMLVLGLPVVVLLADLGPLPGNNTSKTVWRRGMRVVNDVTGEPIRPSDVVIGQLVNAEPEILVEPESEEATEARLEAGAPFDEYLHGHEMIAAKAKAAVILVRIRPEEIDSEQTANWGIDGILCYSKICTHVGCPIALWEQQTHHLLCPCHQSTFDLADDGKVLFGPAARSLPQLPLELDDEGYLIAQSDFLEPTGPSFWERG